ncbi:hypothetical protein QQ045_017699 [Rhodiola kirilowii]
MGNFASCTLSSSSSKAVKVILPTREIRQLKEDTKAAELMMEFPSYFLVNSSSMQIGRRFSALSADEDLEVGNVYIMFPMRRVSSTVEDGDVAVLFTAAKMRMVVVADEQDVKKDENIGSVCNFEEVEGSFEEKVKYRLSVCKSRKPKLETIKEEPIC